ncbi:hypothetical protein SLS60_003921 [Paraconiothyrium brasiliense]|uniref:Uncharacterized protein n=1 Tax=Paraconiothyrium brasiliense TaxID=300254 RepID=A0ABR3RQ14_9PLEO
MDEIADAQATGPPFANEVAVSMNQGSVDRNVNAQTVAKGRKRKDRSEQGEKHEETTVHGRLMQKELEKSKNFPSYHSLSDLVVLLDNAEIDNLDTKAPRLALLRLLYLTIGSCHIFQDSGLIVETPATRMTGPRAMPGNPVNRAQANLTDEVLERILPGLPNGSAKYQDTRRHVSQLRRLANILTMWTDAYGYGVLALLTPGPIESDFPLTDIM